MTSKRIISFILCITMLLCMLPTIVIAVEPATTVTTIIAASDFQNESGNVAGAQTLTTLLEVIGNNGVNSADGFFCCGDYDYEYTDTKNGIDTIKTTLQNVVSENLVFVQGNHDSSIGTNGMAQSGNNDPASDAYGVFVINEDDYMWHNSDEKTIKRTAQNLVEYLNAKIETGYSKPIFVLSHLPLHYSMRTKYDGDGKYANYIFDVLNEAGQKGLNIVFMFGHNHSNGWDDYLGGAAIYLAKGDKINIAQSSNTEFEEFTLNFTYMNPGYIGYYRDVNDADTTLTLSVLKITDTSVAVTRYDQQGVHNLKSAGDRNDYKNESGYNPDTTVYTSPQTITLTQVNDSTPLTNVIEPPAKTGDRYVRITNANQLKDGGKYLLFNTTSSSIMLPNVVTKSSGSSSRIGFDVENHPDFYVADIFYGDYCTKNFTLTKSGSKWMLGDGLKYTKFTSTSTTGITATLETDGNLFTISGSTGAFTFISDDIALNYNSRGVINGFNASQNPAPFDIYEFTGHTVTVKDGTASVEYANAGETVTITANPAPEGYVFDKWTSDSTLTFENENEASTTFTMPKTAIKLTPTYKKYIHTCTYLPEWKYDDNQHWHQCEADETHKADIAVHLFESYKYNNDATLEKDGTQTATCICGKTDTKIAEGTKLEPEFNFTDVPEGKWFYEYAYYAAKNNLMIGTTDTTFEPDTKLNRATFVTILAKVEGVYDSLDKDTKTQFKDIASGKWYTGAVAWAVEAGITLGTSSTTFEPMSNITREQMCTMLVRYSSYNKIELDTTKVEKQEFKDAAKISKFAKEAVTICQMSGLVNGLGDGNFGPKETATRAQAAKIFSEYYKNYMAI